MTTAAPSDIDGLSGDLTRAFEQPGGGCSEDKPANVREIGDTAGLNLRYCAGVNQLSEKPKTYQQRSRDHGDPREQEDEQYGFNLVARVSHYESAGCPSFAHWVLPAIIGEMGAPPFAVFEGWESRT